jgi:hypothetical protein
MTPFMADQPIARLQHTQDNTEKLQTASVPWLGFEPMISVFEWAKTIHASTVISCKILFLLRNVKYWRAPTFLQRQVVQDYSAEMSFNSWCEHLWEGLKCGAVKVNWPCPEIFYGYIVFCCETVSASQWVSSSQCHFFTLIWVLGLSCHWSSAWNWTGIVKPKDLTC